MFLAYKITVGVGRPFLYAFSSYGQEGVEQALQILHVWSLHTFHHRRYSLVH